MSVSQAAGSPASPGASCAPKHEDWRIRPAFRRKRPGRHRALTIVSHRRGDQDWPSWRRTAKPGRVKTRKVQLAGGLVLQEIASTSATKSRARASGRLAAEMVLVAAAYFLLAKAGQFLTAYAGGTPI